MKLLLGQGICEEADYMPKTSFTLPDHSVSQCEAREF